MDIPNKFINFLVLGCMLTCIAIMFFYCIPYQDELAYAYKSGMSSGACDQLERISTFKDIYEQQHHEYYCNGNGRVLIHSILAFFSSHRLYMLFRFISVIIWFVFSWFVLKHGNIVCDSLKDLIGGLLLVHCFIWNSDSTCRDASYTINYLWCATFMLITLNTWFNLKSWVQIPIAFVMGASQEIFVLPLCCALGGSLFLQIVAPRFVKYRLTMKHTVFFVVYLIGMVLLLSSPASRQRADGTMNNVVVECAKSGINFVLYFWPIILLLALFHVLVSQLREKILIDEFCLRPEWLILIIASFGLLIFLGYLGARVMMPFMICCTIFVFQHRHYFSMLKKWKNIVLPLILTWIVLAALMQYRCGSRAYKCLAQYDTSESGITSYDPVKLGPFVFSCYQVKWLRGTSNLVAAEYGKDEMMIILPEKIYQSLIIGNSVFFDKAKTIGDFGYFLQGCERCVIQKGNEKLSIEQKELLEKHFEAKFKKINHLKKYLPLRLILAWPPNDAFAIAPPGKDTITFKGMDNQVYTAYFCSSLDF